MLTEAEKLQLCLERDRLLCSDEFARSPTMSKLLRFLADHKLQEENTPLTAYTVAVDGLGRDDSFDTQIDSYPRVQIGRLRRMLDHFYLLEASEHRLFIPYRNYEIILGANEGAGERNGRSVDPEPSGQEPTRPSIEPDQSGRGIATRIARSPVLALLVAGVLLAIAVLYFLQKSDSVTTADTGIAYPAVIVKGPDRVVDASSRATLETIHSQLIGSLGKFEPVRVFEADANPIHPSQYLLESSSLSGGTDRVQLRLVDSITGEVIWSRAIETATSQKQKADLDRAAIDIAGPYGKIAQHEMAKFRSDYSAGYPCLLQFHQYIRNPDPAHLDTVVKCMDASARQFPNDAYLMSMLAVAKNMSEKFDFRHEIDGPRESFAVRAAKLDNNSASATFAVAQSAFLAADCRKGVAWGERAVSLNPLNSRIMGLLGTYMLACDMPEGEAHATRALELDSNADPVVVATVAMAKLQRGEAKAAQELSSEYLETVSGAAPGLEIIFILSSAMLGEKEKARQAWRLLAERSGFPETAEPRDVIGRWIANPAIVRKLEADLKKARLY